MNMTFDKTLEFLNKLLEKPNGARPYQDYINNYLAKDFATDIVKKIIEMKKLSKF